MRNNDFHLLRRLWRGRWVMLAVGASAGAAWAQTTGRPPVSPTPALPPLLVTHLDDRQAAPGLDGPRRITLSVSRPMPIGDLLLLLVNGTPLSLVTDNDVKGDFTGDLKDLTMRQALEAVLFPRGLDYDVQETLVRVFPRKMSTRLFTINYLNVRRTLERRVANLPSVGSSNPSAGELSTVASADFYDDLDQGVQSLLSASGRVHVDRTAGLVHVTDFAERLDQVGVYLEALQLRAGRQVRIDAQVLSIALWPGSSTSIDWTAPAIRSAARVSPSSGSGAIGLSVMNVDALTKALAEQGVVTKVAAPHIIAMNNEPAVVRAGRELVYFDVAETPAARGDKRTVSPATVLDGLTLTIVAQVSADNFVQLHVSPAYATQSGESKTRDVTVPVLTVNQADTLMRVRDGDTIVLAGFLSTAEKSEPRGGIARLFGAESRTTVRSEVVVLLTPRIMKM